MIRATNDPVLEAVDQATARFLRKVVVFHREGGPPDGVERRSSVRCAFEGAVLVRRCCADGSGLGVAIVCHARDLSLDGIRFVAYEEMKAGGHVQVSFIMPRGDRDATLQFLAQIRHVLPGLAGEWQVGCEFVSTPAGAPQQ